VLRQVCEKNGCFLPVVKKAYQTESVVGLANRNSRAFSGFASNLLISLSNQTYEIFSWRAQSLHNGRFLSTHVNHK
jgi:hypothetical protein